MLEFAKKHGANLTHSQFGEEGILIEALSRLGIDAGHAVEIGANNGIWCSNTALLLKNGWTGKMVEADFNLWQQCCEVWKDHTGVNCQCAEVDQYNINAFVDDKCVVLSIDTDGGDYNILKTLKAKPAIIIAEIDSSIPPTQDGFNHEGGASYKTMVELGISKGYFLLCHTANLVFVDAEYKDLFPEITGDPIADYQQYFNTSHLH